MLKGVYINVCKLLVVLSFPKSLACLSHSIETDAPHSFELNCNQYCENCLNISSFSRFNSSLGRAGSSRLPPGVHCASTSSPKMASRASLTASVPALLSPRSLGCCLITRAGAFNFSLLIADDGNALLAFITGKGFGLGLDARLKTDGPGGVRGGCST